ncbi:MAG: hypothetical protein LUD77_11035 [Clostridiales bacterium]|nr:hypothetical protein [Clostridiales bacterium]
MLCYRNDKKEAVDEAVQAERKAAKEAVQAERKAAKEAVQAERKAAKEAESKAVILTTIENYREFNVTETDIEKRIREKFNLSQETAKEYMLIKSA